MPWTPPGYKIFETSSPLTLVNSPLLTGWYDTTGYTTILLNYVFTNSTGTTTMTIEGSFDGTALDTDMTYSALAASPQLGAGVVVNVVTPYIRFRIVQATADATRTKIHVQARA